MSRLGLWSFPEGTKPLEDCDNEELLSIIQQLWASNCRLLQPENDNIEATERHKALLADRSKLEEALAVMITAQHRLETQVLLARAAIQKAMDYLQGVDIQ